MRLCKGFFGRREIPGARGAALCFKNRMKVLFITSSRIGDAVLSTGLLDHIVRLHEGARITVVCGPLAASLFEGVPGLERVISLVKRRHNAHWIALWREVVRGRWDLVVDLRDSAVSRLIFARERYVYSRYAPSVDRTCHKAVQCAQVMKLDFVPEPRIWVSAGQARRAAALIPPGGPVLAVGPAANWIGKTWPADRFAQLVHALTDADGILAGARVAVFAAPGEEEAACAVLHSVPEGRRIDVIGKTDPGTAAAALQRCALYVGNDSGLMHSAAAAGVPTVGLFGPSRPDIYGPRGACTAYVRTPESFEELTGFPGYDPKTLDRSLMLSLTAENVIAGVLRFWRERGCRALPVAAEADAQGV